MAFPLVLHHIGCVVPDIAAAIDWSARALGMRPIAVEPTTTVDGPALGVSGRTAILRGVLLYADSSGRPGSVVALAAS